MKYVAYLRTSTKDQLLGIEAQRAKAQAYAQANHGEILAEFSEHESGKNNARPELAKAIAECEKTGATLLIAKLDRLSRKVSFLFELKEQLDAKGLEAICVDMPEIMQNTMLLGIMATLAQQERELISERTKAALAAKKAQGVRLGRPKGGDVSKAVEASVRKRQELADEWAQENFKLIRHMVEAKMKLNKIAQAMNDGGISTRRGGKWTATAVKRLIERCA